METEELERHASFLYSQVLKERMREVSIDQASKEARIAVEKYYELFKK